MLRLEKSLSNLKKDRDENSTPMHVFIRNLKRSSKYFSNNQSPNTSAQVEKTGGLLPSPKWTGVDSHLLRNVLKKQMTPHSDRNHTYLQKKSLHRHVLCP